MRGDRVHIAGGVALVHAAELDARTMDENGWALVERFAPPRGGDIRRWRQPLIIGEAKAVADLSRAVP